MASALPASNAARGPDTTEETFMARKYIDCRDMPGDVRLARMMASR